MFYKIVENGYITMIGSPNVPSNGKKIEPEEHARLDAIIKAKPADTLESIYRLSNEIEEYVPVPRTHEETVDWYVEKVSNNEMTLDDVPEDYRTEVESKLPTPEVDRYQQGYEQAVLDMTEQGLI